MDEKPVMSDLIERQKAIEALGEKPVGDTDWDLGCRNQWEWDTEILRTLPTAEPEQQKGEWKKHKMISRDYGKIYYQHDCCCDLYESPYNYCPNCGAKMKRGNR